MIGPLAGLHPLCLGLLVVLGSCRSPEPELPVIATVPDFALKDQSGHERHATELDGKVTVVAFLFTRCTSICPMLVESMANFQRRLGADARRVQFLGFSVDPTHDTPEVMTEYLRQRGTPHDFKFLTGDAPEIHRVAVTGFRAAVGEPTATVGGGVDVIHTQHLMLIDQHRRMRGFYRTDADGLEALERDVGRLIRAE